MEDERIPNGLQPQFSSLITACPFCLQSSSSHNLETIEHLLQGDHYANFRISVQKSISSDIQATTPPSKSAKLMKILQPKTFCTLGHGFFPKNLHHFISNETSLPETAPKKILEMAIDGTHQMVIHRARTISPILRENYLKHQHLEDLHLWLRCFTTTISEHCVLSSEIGPSLRENSISPLPLTWTPTP